MRINYIEGIEMKWIAFGDCIIDIQKVKSFSFVSDVELSEYKIVAFFDKSADVALEVFKTAEDLHAGWIFLAGQLI